MTICTYMIRTCKQKKYIIVWLNEAYFARQTDRQNQPTSIVRAGKWVKELQVDFGSLGLGTWLWPGLSLLLCIGLVLQRLVAHQALDVEQRFAIKFSLETEIEGTR